MESSRSSSESSLLASSLNHSPNSSFRPVSSGSIADADNESESESPIIGRVDVRMEPVDPDEEYYGVLEEEIEPEIGSIGSCLNSYGLSREVKSLFTPAFNELRHKYQPILEQMHPGHEVEFRQIDLGNLEIIYLLDGERQRLEIDEEPLVTELKQLMIENTHFRSFDFTPYRKGSKAPAGLMSALSQSSYRLDTHFKSPRYDKVEDFLRAFKGPIFAGLTPKQCYQLRRQLHMRDVIHQGLGIKIERKILALRREMEGPGNSAHKTRLQRSVSKLGQLRDRLNTSDRTATLLATAYRFRRRVLSVSVAGRPPFDEAAFREDFKTTIKEAILRFQGSNKDNPALLFGKKTIPSNLAEVLPDDMIRSQESPGNRLEDEHYEDSRWRATQALGWTLRDDSLQEEEEKYIHDVVSMTITGNGKRKAYRDFCKANKQDKRSDSLEEVLFVDVLDQLEESVAQVTAHRKDQADDVAEPVLECSAPALVGLFEDALKGTVNTADSARISLAQEFIQYLTVDLYKAMAERMAGIDAEFDKFQGVTVTPEEVDNQRLHGLAPENPLSDERFRVPIHRRANQTTNLLGRNPQATLGDWATRPNQTFRSRVLGHGFDFDDEYNALAVAMNGMVIRPILNDPDDQGIPYHMRPLVAVEHIPV